MILIRKAVTGDAELIASFQVKMAFETENLSLDPEIVIRGVEAVIADPCKGCYYVAEKDGLIAGSLLITFEWSDWRNGNVVWIQSVYILPQFRKKRIFSRLYWHIKQMVEVDPDLHGIRLYVDSSNSIALRVYRRCGMDDGHYRLFEWLKN